MATISKRTSSKGELSYQVKIRLHGVQTSKTFLKLQDARKWARDTEAAIQAGTFTGGGDTRGKTLKDAIERYVRDILPKKSESEQENQGHQLEVWAARLGHVRLTELRAAPVLEIRDQLLAEPGPRGQRSASTANRYVAGLSSVLSAAVRWDWIQSNPLRGRKLKLQEPRGRVRFLSDQEREALLEACTTSSYPHLRLIVLLALSTGARKEEILGLTWDRVDLPRAWAWFDETKNGERRGVPLVGAVLPLLQELQQQRIAGTPLLFPSHRDPRVPIDIRRPWETAAKVAGLEGVVFHTLRHSAASYLVMSGASLAEVSEILGHKSLSMVKRYAHLSSAHVSGAVGRMAEKYLQGGAK